ncbi:MAG: hypothetical protein ABI477_17755 [Chryseolinea sp.]
MQKIKSVAPLSLILVALLCTSADTPKLIKVKVNDEVTVLVPKEWMVMNDQDIVQRYPSVRAPLLAYTNLEREADFSVNISATQWPDDNVEIAQKFFKAGLMNIFDRVEIIDEGISQISGKKFIFFEFESRMNGSRKQEEFKESIVRYTYIQYYIQPGRALVFSFSCPKRLREHLQETARQMMKGVKVK